MLDCVRSLVEEWAEGLVVVVFGIWDYRSPGSLVPVGSGPPEDSWFVAAY